MATITGFTAEHMQEILDGTLVEAAVNPSGDLIFTRQDGTPVNAGSVIGPEGPTGPTGPTSIIICTSATRPGTPVEGQFIYETDTDRVYSWNGIEWVQRGLGVRICTSGTRPTTGITEGVQIYETDTDRFLMWTGTTWTEPRNLLTLVSADYGKKLQSGQDIVHAINGQVQSTTQINFPAAVAFGTIPKVVVTLRTVPPNPVNLYVTAVTTTTFTVGIKKSDGTAFGADADYSFDWFAIG
jgi:hypothetical protein